MDDKAISFSKGEAHNDAHPTQYKADTLDDFIGAIDGWRYPKKLQGYICAGMRDAHRCKDSALPVRFIGVDFDYISPDRFVDVSLWLAGFSGCAWPTHSDKPEKRRLRAILMLDREADADEVFRIGQAFVDETKKLFGTNVKVDPCTFQTEQPNFLPPPAVVLSRFFGDELDVDAWLARPAAAHSRGSRKSTFIRADEDAQRDPVYRRLVEKEMLLGKNPTPGWFNVACPCSDQHDIKSSPSSTTYMLPNYGGRKWGRFHCLHTPCAGRDQKEFITALGLDPVDVWREQAGTDAEPQVDFGGTKKSSTPGDGVVVRNGADLVPKPMQWLWKHWLALGKMHIIAGLAGQGKTTIVLSMAAIVTRGGFWPDGAECKKGSVLIWSGEDDPNDTLMPRLLAMGADRTKVNFVEAVREQGKTRPFDPARDMVALTAAAERIGDVKLLMVDPVVNAVAGDSHKNTEVRRALQPLVDLGQALQAAVVGVTHFSKGSGGLDPTERVVGSVAFGALARLVMAAAKLKSEDDETTRRVLVRAKSNIGPDGGGFNYTIEQGSLEGHPDVEASYIVWGDPVEGTAREILGDAEQDADPAAASALADAVAFLRAELEPGERLGTLILGEGKKIGHSERTIKRAKAQLKVRSRKTPMGWYWSLPEGTKDAKDAKDAKEKDGTLAGTVEKSEAEEPKKSNSASKDAILNLGTVGTVGTVDSPDDLRQRARTAVLKHCEGLPDWQRDAWLADAEEDPASVLGTLS